MTAHHPPSLEFRDHVAAEQQSQRHKLKGCCHVNSPSLQVGMPMGSSSCCPGSKVRVRYRLSRSHAFRAVVPALERGGEALTVSGGGHLVAARAEQVGGFIVGAEEPLRLPCRFESALVFLALSRGSVRSLNTIVQSLVRPVIHVQPELPQGRAVAAQFVRHDDAGLTPAGAQRWPASRSVAQISPPMPGSPHSSPRYRTRPEDPRHHAG